MLGLLPGLLLTLLLGCTADREPAPADDPGATARLSDCAAVSADEVRGRRPAYLPAALDPTPVDSAVCDALWLPRLGRGFVPQGLAVRAGTAWVSGYDQGRPGHLFCRVLRLDLRTGELERQAGRVSAASGATEILCRHGGGLGVDEHGLWLFTSARLWLLDPRTLDVVRLWALERPVQGSWGALDGRGRIALGRFRADEPGVYRGPPRVEWFDLGALLSPGVTSIGPGEVVERRAVPSHAQGATWASWGARPGLWIASSSTRCGVLTAPSGRRLAFVPGAEGIAVVGDHAWVVSESTARPYARLGDRPIVPSLVRLDLSRAGRWPGADCAP